MKLSKTLVLPVAALLVAIGAGAVLASTGLPVTDQPASAPAAATPTPTPTPSTKPFAQDQVLSGVLDDLVSKGTITAAQETAILDALQAKRDQIVADRKAAAEKLRQEMQQIRGFLSDGQITQDELDQLPADSPLRELTNLMADGKITVDELRSIGNGILRDLGLGLSRGGHGFAPRLFGGRNGWPGAGPNASPSPSPTSGSSS